MGRPKKTAVQLDKLKTAREAKIYQADTLLQKGRFELSLTEQRLILYAISQIKPTDDKFKEYTLKILDFFDICGIKQHESYDEIKKILHALSSKTWWITVDIDGEEWESAVRWFNIVRTNKKSGRFTIAFHPDMMPYLLKLAQNFEEGGGFYTPYTFRHVLPMKSQYSIRLYQLLKSYQKNNRNYWFKLDELKRLLDCRNYKNFKDFRVNVLEPAMREINKYSDLNISYEIRDKEGKRITELVFYMDKKSVEEQLGAERAGLTELDGKVHYWDNPDILPGQISIFDLGDS